MLIFVMIEVELNLKWLDFLLIIFQFVIFLKCLVRIVRIEYDQNIKKVNYDKIK